MLQSGHTRIAKIDIRVTTLTGVAWSLPWPGHRIKDELFCFQCYRRSAEGWAVAQLIEYRLKTRK